MHVSATTEPRRGDRRRHHRGRRLRRPRRATRGLPGAGGRAARIRRGARARSRRSRLPTPRASGGCWWAWASTASCTPERARVAAAAAHARAPWRSRPARSAGSAGGRRIATLCAALVEGTVLADYRFERHKSAPAEGVQTATDKQLESLILSAPNAAAEALERTVARGGGSWRRPSTRARDLQNRPGNDLTPTALAELRAGARRGDRGPAGRGRGPRGHRSRAAWARSRRSRRAPSRSPR